MSQIQCVRCGIAGESQAFKPFANEMGTRIYESICKECWAKWLTTQQQLINHYALIPHQPKAKEFLLRNMEQFLFGDGAPDSLP